VGRGCDPDGILAATAKIEAVRREDPCGRRETRDQIPDGLLRLDRARRPDTWGEAADFDDPALRAALQVGPFELPAAHGLELVEEGLGVMVDDQPEGLADRHAIPAPKDLRVPLPRRQFAHIQDKRFAHDKPPTVVRRFFQTVTATKMPGRRGGSTTQ